MKKIRILSAAAAAATTAALMGVSAGAYNAYIGFQTTQYSFRNEWTEANYGKDTDYFNSFIVWGNADTDPETFPEYEDNFDYDIGGYVLPAEYTDVEFTEDGTYTVKAEGIDWDVKGDTDFNFIIVSTDIPAAELENGVKITEAKIIVDGETVKTVTEPLCEGDEYVKIDLANIYNDAGSYGLTFPTESLAVEFTVEGLGGDAAAETEAAAEEAAPAETEAAAEEAAPAETEAAVDAATAGDTTAATTSTKGSPDTGIADVAVAAGLALLAGGAVALTRKKK